MKHKPCAHQHARGHRFGKELGLFLSRKNKDTGIPTSCLETELWIERGSQRMSGSRVTGRRNVLLLFALQGCILHCCSAPITSKMAHGKVFLLGCLP